MDLKALYQRFRAWQQEPFTYKAPSDEPHQCANCGNTYQGNYCPVCGQSHTVGGVDWAAVDKDLKTLLGVKDPRPMFSYLTQLFGRTGYMISDYLKGRRGVCGSPLTMLGLIALSALAVLSISNPSQPETAALTDGSTGLLGVCIGWMSAHLNLAILIETALLVFPTWLLFRYAPRHTRHTLPEGIYIQVFMASLVMIGIIMMLLLPRTKEFLAAYSVWTVTGMVVLLLAIGAGILVLGWWAGKRTARKANNACSYETET